MTSLLVMVLYYCDFVNIHKYLVKKPSNKQFSYLLNKLLLPYEVLEEHYIARVAKVSDLTKCTSLNNEPCLAKPNLIYLTSIHSWLI